MTRTYTYPNFRNPANEEIRRLVGLAQEDALSDIMAALGNVSSPVAAILKDGKIDVNDIGSIMVLVSVLGPLFAGLLKTTPKPVELPEPKPIEEDEEDEPEPPVGVRLARIVGGTAKFTGMTERGAQGPRLGNWKAIIEGRENSPHDCRFELDCTPNDGKAPFGPTVNGNPDPRWMGQPNAKGWGFPMRLHFDYEGPGSADLVHEYANFGCTPRIRVRQPKDGKGVITGVYFEGPDYGDGNPPAIISVTDGPIYIGRR